MSDSQASSSVVPPAPDPPTEGWWLDPDNPRLIRYHDGQRWTDHVGRPSAPRPGLPAHQAFFPLGAGPEGIPTGSPLAPGSGRYLSKYAVWGLGCLIIVGLLVGAYGIGAYQAGALSLAAAAPMIVAGGLLFFGPMVVAFVSAWRAGIRPPGFSRRSSSFERQLGFVIFGGLLAGLLQLVADSIGEGTTAGRGLRTASNILFLLVLATWALPSLWSLVRQRDQYERGDWWMFLLFTIGFSVLAILVTAGVIDPGTSTTDPR